MTKRTVSALCRR